MLLLAITASAFASSSTFPSRNRSHELTYAITRADVHSAKTFKAGELWRFFVGEGDKNTYQQVAASDVCEVELEM